jgi:phosphate-selective porin OprO/OprP
MTTLRSLLLAGVALAAFAAPAMAQDNAVLRRLNQMQKMLDDQQRQIEAQKKEIGDLSRALQQKPQEPQPVAQPVPAPAPPAVVETRLQQQDQKIEELKTQAAAQDNRQRLAAQEQPAASISNGRLSLTSADGRFSAALRATVQYDLGLYMQSAAARNLPAANGPDLSSGGNFRRAQLGLQGKVFGDWAYYVNIDYGSGGSTGTETPGHIQQAYIEYDGFAPLAFRIGAHPPSTGMDDSYVATDQLFLERAAPSDLARNMAGGDGRDSIEALYLGDRLFASLAFTGDKVQATGVFDEQQALVGRAAYTVLTDSDWRWVVSAAATDVFRPGDSNATLTSPRPFSLSNPPELIVDDQSTKLVSVSDANVTDAWNWNVESGVTFDNFLAQAGYFQYGIDQRGLTSLRGQGFDGWYAEASWVLTGESRGWSSANGAFTGPRPRINFSPGAHGWGAFEVAARYSALDLNDNAGVLGGALPAGGVRGGEQRITTLGLNWYPNSVVKFMLQAQNVQISRLNGATAAPPIPANGSLGQNFNTLALRSQIAF